MTSQWEGGRILADTVGGGPPAVQSWEPVSVPGRPERFVGADAVAYRLQFADPRSTPAQRALIEFQGLYGHTRVWLNGELLGTHREYFAPARFEFEPAAENELVVECHRPEDGFGGVYETDHVRDALAVPGIWWGVHLRLRPPAFLRDLVVNPRLTDDGGAIDVAVSVDTAESVAEPVTLSLRPEGFRGGGAMEREQVEADPGDRITVTRTLTLREPSLWWPRNHGDQHRYVVRAKFRDHEITTTTALRTVDFGAGEGLQVNGSRVRARGVNVLPSDDPLGDFERVDEAGFTLARLHAHVAPPELYEAADEAGVLVWQDCPLSGDVRVDPERGRTVARTLASTVDHHPSVALFGVHDDPETPFDARLSGGRMDRLRFRRRTGKGTDARGAAERIADALPADRPVFPVCGQPGTEPDAAHLYPGWTFGDADAVDWLCATVPELTRVVTEFGAGSLTESGAEPTGLDREIHDTVVGSADPALSQATQTRILKRVAETLRLQGADVLAGFCLRDAGVGGGMGILDVDGESKPAYDALATSLRPVVPVLREVPAPGSRVEARLLNDAPAEVQGRVRWSFEGPQAGDSDAGGSVSVTAPPFESVAAGAVSVPADASALELSLETGTTAVVNRYRL
jgi:beta-mannosidase